MDDLLFTVFIIDGNIADFAEPYTSVVRFTDQTQSEALDIAQRSLLEGYTVAAFVQCSGAEAGENADAKN